VRALREIAARIRAATTHTDSIGAAGQLARIFRFLGIFGTRRSSFSSRNGGGIGHTSRIPQPGGVKQRKPGSHWGAVCSDTDGGLLAVGSDTLMGTAERHEAPTAGDAAHLAVRRSPEALDHDIPARRDGTGSAGRA